MRMRHKPYARPELEAWPMHINTPQDFCGKWSTAFENQGLPLRVELGCGKGGFLAQLALANPQFNHLGIDIKSEVLVVAKRNIEEAFSAAQKTEDNVRITAANIEKINSIISPADAADRVYINFCNPWYKSGHAKHRLTHPRQLVKYRDFLRQNGEIWFKTDDGPLFEDSLRYFEYTGFEISWLTRDLHAEEPEWNIRTEHENMFAAEGIPIKACIARMVPKSLNKEEILKLKNI